MPETGIQERHKVLAFYGVPSTGQAGYVWTRMKYFTSISTSKNPIEHNRKYVDEATQRNDVVGYDTSISYAFDKYTGDQVLTDIVNIHNKELTGEAAIRPILIVDTFDGSASTRNYAVIPDAEGDDANIYTYSGNFKANGELSFGTATTTDNWVHITFTADEDQEG